MEKTLHPQLTKSKNDFFKIDPFLSNDDFHLIEIINAEYAGEYKLILTFDNSVKKLVDLKDRLDGEIFEPLKKIEYFRQVKVEPELGTICWSNGADFAPDTLYNIGKELE